MTVYKTKVKLTQSDIDLYEEKYFRYISYENVVKMMLTYCREYSEEEIEKIQSILHYYIGKLASFREELERIKSDLGWKYIENIPNSTKVKNINFNINHDDGVIIYSYELV